MVRLKSYAKVNLTLEVTGVADGYHQLDSLVANVDLYDLLVLKKRKTPFSQVVMHGLGSESIPPENNNALKAAETFSRRFGVNGAEITIYKNIPIGAGLGGSSADIVGVINGMARLYKIDDRVALKELADSLGSDTGYMLNGGLARLRGRGDEVAPLSIAPTLHFLLLCPSSSVSSKACYQTYDSLPKTLEWKENAAEGCIRALQRNDLNEVGRYLTNDLFRASIRLNADVEKAYEEALSFSPLGVTMTGSGSAVLALFESKELCEWAKSRYRGKSRALVVKTVMPDYTATKNKPLWKNPFVLTAEEIAEAETDE